jgi:hypothetical protein
MPGPVEVATRASWKTVAMSSHRALLFTAAYSDSDFARIAAGFVPREMEDKWFLFFEDGTLFVHRSWTGFCIYEVDFERSGGEWVVSSARVNRDPEQYGETDDARDARMVGALIDGFLLRRPAAPSA